MRGVRVLAVGFYGHGNAGDELLLKTLNSWLAEAGAELSVISLDPLHTLAVHGIDAIGYQDLPAVARRIAQSDLVMLGGGGLFQDYHRFELPDVYEYPAPGITYYAQACLVARQFGKPVLLWAMGLGPLRTGEARAIVRDLFGWADTVSLRDEESAALLRELGVEREVTVAPDPVWALEMPDPAIPGWVERFPELSGHKVLAVIVREWQFSAGWEDRLTTALEKSLPPGWGCLWVPFQSGDDRDRNTASGLISRLGDSAVHRVWEPASLDDLVGGLARTDAVLAMRLHGAILGLRLGVPTLSIAYDSKVAAATDSAAVAPEARLMLTDSRDRWEEALSNLFSDSPRFQIGPDRSRELAELARGHKKILFKVLKKIQEESPGPEWSSADLNWLYCWELARNKAVSRLAVDLEGARTAFEGARMELAERKEHIVGLEAALRDAQADSEQKTEKIESLVEQLNFIYTSRSWKLVSQGNRVTAHLVRWRNIAKNFVKTIRVKLTRK